jgi:transposase
MACERPPAAFDGSPPCGACPSNLGGTKSDQGVNFTAGMAKIFRDWNPEQSMMFPPSALDLVPKSHLAHFIRNVVSEQLDLSEIMDSYTEERGYPPDHPVMMTALLLYANAVGIYSSRRIARACQERVDFMALTGMQNPQSFQV